MKLIDLSALHVISPLQVTPGVAVNYYSPQPFNDGDVLYVQTQTGTTFYLAGKTKCTRMRRAVRIGGTDRSPVYAQYLVKTYLQTVSGATHREELQGLLLEAGRVPF